MKKNVLKLILVAVVLSLVAFALTACGEDVQLATPANVSYDGATLSWDRVDGATGYTIQINDGKEYKVTAAKFPFNANGAEFMATISAITTDEDILDSEAVTVSFSPLPTITQVRFDENGAASWDAVAGATAYAIRIDGVEQPLSVAATLYSQIPGGQHSFQVRPIVEGDASYYSSWSSPYSVSILGQVSKDTIKYADGMITWGGVGGARSYEVTVNGSVLAAANIGTSVIYDANNLNFEVSVRAMGDGSYSYNGQPSESKRFVFLDTVTNIVVENGILKWDAISEADGYLIKINGVQQSQRLSSNEYAHLVANVSTEIQVRPFSNNDSYFSDWSQSMSVLILPAPVLQWNQDYELDGEPNNNAYWDGNNSAAGYTVRLTLPNGQVTEREYSSTERSFAEAYLEVGTYKIEVKAKAPADSSTVYDSVYSAPITVIRLATPKAASNNFITSDPGSVAKGFTVTFDKVAGATQYELYKDGASFKLTNTNQFIVGDVVANNVTAEQNYNFKIKAKGGVQRVGGQIVATLDSITEQALPFQIKVLAAPTNPTMDGFRYLWGGIVGAEGYTIDVGGTSYVSTNLEYDLSLLEAGNFAVKVCARGNGSTILASNYTAATNVFRLSPPTNIRISTEGSEGVLTFDKIMYAQGYYIVFNNDGNAIPVNDMMNVYSYITEQPGTDIHMIASANYFSDDGTVYYMTSQSSTTFRCIRLMAPTFGEVAFTENQFVWRVPGNINTSVYTPTYIVFNENGIAYNGEKNGTTMDISYLEGGMDYTFIVKAIGNGTSYVNSVESAPKTIHKLQTPIVYRENGKYVWSAVPRATGYVVYIDGVVKATFAHEPGEVYEFTPDFRELKNYTVEIQAIGDEGYTTINSNKCTIIQETKQLTTPKYDVSYSEERYSNTGAIVITITEQPLYAKGYSYTIGGTTHTSAETSYSLIPNSVGSIETRVFALGGNFDADGIYYLDSQSAGGASKTVTLLAAPDAADFVLGQDGVLMWGTIQGAVGYDLTIIVNGMEIDLGDDPITKTSYTLQNFREISTLYVQIAAKGNGKNIVSSVYSEREWVNVNR